MSRIIPQSRAVLRARVIMACAMLLGGAVRLGGQEYIPDTLYFEPVAICYPGQPDTGQMKTVLCWKRPPEPECRGVRNVSLSVTWTGAIQVDSFLASPSLGDTLDFNFFPHNDSNRVGIGFSTNAEYLPLGPGIRELGALHFTVLDTGVVVLDTLEAPFMTPSLGIYWFGYWITKSNNISNPGDFNNDGVPGDVMDAVWLVSYIFGPFADDSALPFADANEDCLNNISDVVYLLRYIFNGGPAAGSGCPL